MPQKINSKVLCLDPRKSFQEATNRSFPCNNNACDASSFKMPLALLSIFFETDLSILRNKLMELELGLKITQTQDDISSTADFRIAKDGGGIVFLSRETENMFILTAHLRGSFFRRFLSIIFY